jgi:uracil-DNA glycosylase family 4
MPQPPTLFSSLEELNSAVVHCELCPRLRRHSLLAAKKKRRQFMDWKYWGRPLPGFGASKGRVLILGLAPAAHGGNRTGRMFTGDGSAQFLMAALNRFGFANQPTSESVNDGLQLKDVYMTAIVRCAPPKNKPKPREIRNCRRYWTQEFHLLPNLRAVLALGRIAFDTYARFLAENGVETRRLKFYHGAFYELPKPFPATFASYHPSRQNTQTGRLTVPMFDQILRRLREFLSSEHSNLHSDAYISGLE